MEQPPLYAKGVFAVTLAAVRTGSLDVLRSVCVHRDAASFRRLLHTMAGQDQHFRANMYLVAELPDFPAASFWTSLGHYLDRLVEVPYQAVYYHDADDRLSHGDVTFLAEAFRALDTYSARALDIYVSPADLSPTVRPFEGRPTYEALTGTLDLRPEHEGDTLFVWKTLDLVGRQGPLRPEPLWLGPFHRDARIGAVATLSLLLQAGVTLPDAVRQARENPAVLEAGRLGDLLPGSPRGQRKATKTWARAYAARCPDRAEGELAAKLITSLGSSSPAQRTSASALIAAILMVSGLLGAPHVLTHDLPESYGVIRDLYVDITTGGGAGGPPAPSEHP